MSHGDFGEIVLKLAVVFDALNSRLARIEGQLDTALSVLTAIEAEVYRHDPKA